MSLLKAMVETLLGALRKEGRLVEREPAAACAICAEVVCDAKSMLALEPSSGKNLLDSPPSCSTYEPATIVPSTKV